LARGEEAPLLARFPSLGRLRERRRRAVPQVPPVREVPRSSARGLVRLKGVSAQLTVRRGRAAVEFYKAAFEAAEVYRVGGTDEHDDVVAQLSVGDTSFWVSDESPAHKNFSPESLGGSTVRLLLVVEDPHAVIERAVVLGATEVVPAQEEHGWLLGRIEDPFGHHWEIGRPVVEWPPSHETDEGS
jgi:PhnB protein